ncbi:hypothetical protein AL08_03760 [Corynebacterium diphtheriae bv. gravis str. ISS 4746]|nr:hypothetical protein AL07_04195 [Corynebacterium diphtheriae bv. gravis str. ISS 4060]KLN42210.1 hypothetical protein AL08_03760 [Corynebacterium diphtheriae bv. gravis str. ISS 4746]KLN44812.1 hypothetical protein AL09_03845 [Corynebacterium diphtheriae bv. gravis str. ISS 4749]
MFEGGVVKLEGAGFFESVQYNWASFATRIGLAAFLFVLAFGGF